MSSILPSVMTHVIIVLNIGCIITVIYFQRKEPSTAFAWIIVLTFLPGIGFCLYMLLGHNYVRKERLKLSADQTKRMHEYVEEQISAITHIGQNLPESRYLRLIQMNLARYGAIITDDNEITTFTNGAQKYSALLEDIKNAEKYIHMLYFIFKGDKIGKQIIAALAEKAKQGVDVKVVYDDLGNMQVWSWVFKPLRKAGGKVYRYSPLLTGILSTNYRNHRKLAIIDGKIGYIGGMNIGDEYADGNKHLCPWRDTHLRITGSSVLPMELTFLEDYIYASHNKDVELQLEKYFDFNNKPTGHEVVQIVSSVPKPEYDSIYLSYMKTIAAAEKYLYIHTPYLIPDKGFMDAIRMAAASGVDVRIMIPDEADKYAVHLATLNFARSMHEMGAKIYIYRGFLHSKMIVADDLVASVGSANMDIRSFNLSFETNAFVYGHKFATECRNQFLLDMESCQLASKEYFDNLSIFKKVLMPIFQLFSPLL